VSKKKRILRWVGGITAVAILVPSVYLLITGEIGNFDIIKASRELDTTLKESERLGLPMTAADLEPNPPVPDADNAALVVAPAALTLPITKDITLPFEVFLPGADPAEREIAINTLNTHRPTLKAIKEGLKRNQWYLARNWIEGVFVQFPEYAYYKCATRFLGTEAVRLAKEDKPEEALSSLTAGRRLAKFCSSEPTMNGILVAIACEAMILRFAENLTEIWAQDDAKLNRLAEVLESTNFTIDPRDAFRTDFYMALNYTRNYDLYGGIRGLGGRSNYDPTSLRKAGPPRSILAKATMTPVAKAWNEFFHKFGDKSTGPSEWGPFLRAKEDEFDNSDRASVILGSALSFYIGDLDRSIAKQELYPKLSLALIRAVQHRNRTGDFPRSLAEINIDSADPLSGDSLCYVIENEGIQIYSLGPDKVDNGGPLMRKNKAKAPDIGVVYPSSRRNKTKQ